MKSLKKQLMAAIAMCLVAAIALSSATYAWFATSNKATATGAKISAQAPTGLLIKGSSEGAEFKSSINFADAVDSKVSTKNAIQSVSPVAYKGSGETDYGTAISGLNAVTVDNLPVLWKLTSAGTDLVKGSGALNTDEFNAASKTAGIKSTTFASLADKEDNKLFTAASYDSTKVDYIKDEFTLKLVGAPDSVAANNKVSVKVTMTTDHPIDAEGAELAPSNIYKAVHVVFVEKGKIHPDPTKNDDTMIDDWTGKTFVQYNDIDMGSGSLTTVTDDSTGKSTDQIVFGADGSFTLDTFDEAEQETTYEMYIFYDGEDEQCNNKQALNMGDYAFNLEFTTPTP